MRKTAVVLESRPRSNMETEDGQFVYTINGVKVAFPCKAYPTQLSMMNMVSLNLILKSSKISKAVKQKIYFDYLKVK